MKFHQSLSGDIADLNITDSHKAVESPQNDRVLSLVFNSGPNSADQNLLVQQQPKPLSQLSDYYPGAPPGEMAAIVNFFPYIIAHFKFLRKKKANQKKQDELYGVCTIDLFGL